MKSEKGDYEMRTKLIATIIITLFLATALSIVSNVSLANAAISGGKFGNALEFDGVDDYVMVSDSSSLRMPSTALTVEAWIYFPASSPGPIQLMIRKWIDADGGWPSYVLATTADNKIYGAVTNKELQQEPTWTTTQTINDMGIEDKWASVAFTWKKENITGTDGRILVNGINEATTFDARGYSEAFTIGYGDYPLYFAREADSSAFSSNYFKGALDEIRISNIARSSFQFVAPPSADTNTVGLWHFDEGTNLIAQDASTNVNHGTISGATWTGTPISPSPSIPEFPSFTAIPLLMATILSGTIALLRRKKRNPQTAHAS